MADTYTKASVTDTHNKDVPITRAWTEDKTEGFTVRELEVQVSDCDAQIQYQTDRKTELEAKIAEAEKILAE